jgi:hypothetical protein
MRESNSQQKGPGRKPPGVVKLFAGMVLAPLAWALQVLVGYGLAAYACYPTDRALAKPLWPQLRGMLWGVSLLLWLLLLCGCAIAWSNWNATSVQSSLGADRVVQAGDGRRRFMALCGVIVSGLFAVVLLFTGIGILWVPSCGP